ncbi:MAG: hypothetical protein OHK0013_46090 [Sandaracinaceae bacterium]
MGSEHLGSEHLGSEHLGSEHLGSEHLGSEHLGSEHLGSFDDEEPTAIDAELVQQMMATRSASTTRSGLMRPRQVKSLADPITRTSPTLREVAPVAAPPPEVRESVTEESSIAPTKPRFRGAPQRPPTDPYGSPAFAPRVSSVADAAASATRDVPPATPLAPPPAVSSAPPIHGPVLDLEAAAPRTPSLVVPALGYLALVLGAGALAFDPLFVPSALASTAAGVYFVLLATSRERRAAMGPRLAFSASCASLGLLLSLVPLMLWLLASAGLVPADLAP